MSDLPAIYDNSAEDKLGTAFLENIRNNALRNIESDPTLPERRKQALIRELDFLIEHERLRRLRKFVFQWVEEREAFRTGILQRRIELANNVRLSMKQTALKIAQLNKDIANCKLDVIERIRRMRPKNESEAYLKKAALELQKLKFQKAILQAKEEMLHENLTNRAFNRQKFHEKVRKLYPDMADEMMEYYDRQVFQQSRRS